MTCINIPASQVENMLYKLHHSMLNRHFAVFYEIWSLSPPQGSIEGLSDNKLIILKEIKTLDFTHFLLILYPSYVLFI